MSALLIKGLQWFGANFITIKLVALTRAFTLTGLSSGDLQALLEGELSGS